MAPLTDYAKNTFKTLLNRYSEENYFYLARNYLGMIKTPFHKPALTTKLCNFLSMPEIEDKIFALIDEMDQIILSLVNLGGQLSGETIIKLLEDRWSYGELVRKVSNLQERMLLLNDGGTLIFNPLYDERLRKLCSLKPLLGDTPSTARDGFYCSGEFLRAYFNIVDRDQRLTYKEEYSSLFPQYESEQLKALFALLGTTLTKLCVLTEERKVSVDFEKAEKLLALNDRQILSLLLSEPYIKELERVRASTFANTLITLLAQVGTGDTESLQLLLKILAQKTGIDYDPTYMDKLKTLGLISSGDTWTANKIAEDDSRSTLLIDSDSTVSYSGTCSHQDILYRFSDLMILDRQTSYQVTAQSFTRGLDGNLNWDQIRTYLETESQPGTSDALIKTLAIAHERYRQATIYDGIVLVSEERITRLVTQLESLQEHIEARLAENIFLMKRATEQTWRAILVQSGVLLPARRSTEKQESAPETSNPLFEKLIEENKTEPIALTIPALIEMPAVTLDSSLRLAIETGQLSKDERSDLEQRFKAKMILVPEQIVAQVVNGVVEAGGFDYQGKVGLCRNAVGKNNIALQLMLPDEELIVQALEVAYTAEKEALLKAAVMPDMEVKIIPVSKIFLVRQLRYHLV